jgi:hypothetical protein
LAAKRGLATNFAAFAKLRCLSPFCLPADIPGYYLRRTTLVLAVSFGGALLAAKREIMDGPL